MQTYDSKYGTIKGIIQCTYFENGSIRECIVNRYNELCTPCGTFVPQFESSGIRKKNINSMTFYKSGVLKSISLQEQTFVKTSIGELPAELLTFYESGAIKRLFPLNGKISAYWTEEDEYGLTEEYTFNIGALSLKSRINGIYFYESGKIKSVTLWPGETLEDRSPLGCVNIRTGISFYADGKIKSLEPSDILPVKTPIGTIAAYDSRSNGINGDNNSLKFYNDGAVQSLTTSTDIVTVTDSNGKMHIFGPKIQPSIMETENTAVIPMRMEFFDGFVSFGGSTVKYEIGKCTFSIRHYPQYLSLGCSDCSKCTMCG